MFDISTEMLVLYVGIIGLIYTFLRAVFAVRREDLVQVEKRLTASIDEVKTAQKEDTAKLESSRKEDTARLESSRKEDTARLEKNQVRLESGLNAINAKFDRYLFGKLEKTDDSEK